MSTTCPDDELQRAATLVGRGEPGALDEVERLVAAYPEDARLHMLQSSLLASLRQYDPAKRAMARAVDLYPGFAIARFQLGFLHFTSGEVEEAFEVWRPLLDLPSDNYVRLFAQGLGHLAADEFAEADELLRRGIAANRANPALNGDMRLILGALANGGELPEKAEEPLSATQLALSQSAARKKLH